MQKFRIRFNKGRGQPGRGSVDHVWRVFDSDGKEYICKNIKINTWSHGEKEKDSDDWNIVAYGELLIDRENSSISIYDKI